MADEQGFDVSSLIEMAQNMQAQLAEAQAEVAAQVVEGQAGGGAVRVSMTGGLEFRAVHIDPSAVDPDDIPMLEDLVLAALNDAVARANEMQQQTLGGLPGLGGLPEFMAGGDPPPQPGAP